MGVWKNITGIWNPDVRAENIIDTQVACFTRYMQRYPERDPNAWLASTLKTRPRWQGAEELTYYIETALFSLVPITEAPRVLGMYIVYKEGPASAVPFVEEYQRIMQPIHDMVGTPKLETFWRSVNPWTLAHFPSVGAGLRNYQPPRASHVAPWEETQFDETNIRKLYEKLSEEGFPQELIDRFFVADRIDFIKWARAINEYVQASHSPYMPRWFCCAYPDVEAFLNSFTTPEQFNTLLQESYIKNDEFERLEDGQFNKDVLYKLKEYYKKRFPGRKLENAI
jgi:hypothetical protein